MSTSKTAIWARIIDSSQHIPDVAAQYILALQLPQTDQDRIHDLALRNNEGRLKTKELDELRNYCQVAVQIDLLRSKARFFLRDLPHADL